MGDNFDCKYIEVYQLTGLEYKEEKDEELFFGEDDSVRAVITNDIEKHVGWLDRRNAAFTLLMDGGEPADIGFEDWLETRLKKEIRRVSQQRKSKEVSGAFLIMECNGSIEINLKDIQVVKKFGNYISAKGLDLGIKIPNGDQMSQQKNRLLVAVNTVKGSNLSTKLITRGSMFKNDSDDELFLFDFKFGPVKGIVQEPFDKDMVLQIREQMDLMEKERGYYRIEKLVSSSISEEGDDFRKFVDAWNALEILTNKLADTYKRKAIKSLVKQAKGRSQVILMEKINKELEDEKKFGLVDKFAFSAEILFDDSPKIIKKFTEFKKLRDGIFHGGFGKLEDSDLPVVEISGLVTDMLARHLKYSKNEIPGNGESLGRAGL